MTIEWIGNPRMLNRRFGLSGREWLQPLDSLGQVPAQCQQQFSDWQYAVNVADAACKPLGDWVVEKERLESLPPEDPERAGLDQINALIAQTQPVCDADRAQAYQGMLAYEACAGKGTVIRPKPTAPAPTTTAPTATATAPKKSNTGLIVLAIATAGALALALS